MAYTLRARNYRTLNWNGREYKDGDRIVISKADAERIALQSQAYRFEAADGDEISFAGIDAATAPTPAPALAPTAPAERAKPS